MSTAGAMRLAATPGDGVSTGDRLAFTLFLASALHAAIILGVGFVAPDASAPRQSIEVTLAHYASEELPEVADFLAQSNQVGSGNLDEARELTTDRDAPLQDVQVQDAVEPVPPPSRSDASRSPRVSAQRADPETADQSAPTPDALDDEQGVSNMLLQQALEMASLDARRASEVQVDARGRRVRRLTSVNTRTAVEAAYLQSWRRKIETIGNLNYPSEARRQGLEGDLRVLVEIDSDGELLDVRILDSSGNSVLDAAALRIVRLAAPFLPFPKTLRDETDVLQIIRTWQFRQRSFSSSAG